MKEYIYLGLVHRTVSLHLRFSAEPLIAEEAGVALLAVLLVGCQVLAEGHTDRAADAGGWII